MTFKDTKHGYSLLTIILHWVVALGLITLFTFAILADEAPTKERATEYLMTHISVAMTLYVVFWARIIWRMTNTRPTLPPQPLLLGLLAYWVPLVLLAALAAQLISGPLTVISGGHSIQAFGVTIVPQLMEKSEGLHELTEEVHEIGAQVIFWAFILHVVGTFKHLVVNRDGTLKKMLVPGNRD